MKPEELLGKTNFTYKGKVIATFDVHSVRQVTPEGDYYVVDQTISGPGLSSERKTLHVHKAAS